LNKARNEKRWSRNHDRCVVCGTTEHRHKSRGYCLKCYSLHKYEIMPVEQCTKCGKTAKGYRDRKTGKFICRSCRASKIKTCYICQEEKYGHTRIGNGAYVCKDCSKYINDGKCPHCGNERKLILREPEAPICYACDARPPAICNVCHSKVKLYKTDENGNTLCKKCYTPAPKHCIICGRFKTPRKRTSKGHVCVDCYQKPLRECSVCGQHKLGYKKTTEGEYLCKNCYYSLLIEQALEDMKGSFEADWLEKLFFEYIEDKRLLQNSWTVWNSIKRDRPLFDMLARNFSNLSNLTAEKFWEKYHHLSRRRTGQLYAFLLDRGYIKYPELESKDYQRHYRILSHIDGLPDSFRMHIRKYFEQFLSVRKKKLEAGWKETDYGTGSYATIEYTVVILKDFVQYLTGLGINSVSEITIYHVDEYIAQHITYARVIKRFMLWLHQERQVAWKYRGKWKEYKYGTPQPIHEEKYLFLINRFLDGSYPLKESLICLLGLVYGIRPKILRKIKVYDLHEEDGGLYLRLPYFEIELHEKIGEMIRQYIEETFLPNPFDIDNPYLFYGYTYKEPMDETSIYNIFHKHGIKSHQILSTVIHRLFNENVRHPAIISKVTGANKATAVRYYDSYNPSVLEELNINRKVHGKIK